MLRANKRRIVSTLNKYRQHKIYDLTQVGFVSPPTDTGISHPKCYAKILNSCCTEISEEHAISKNVLDKIGSFDASGIPWLRHLPGQINSDYMASKCLCRIHNSHLSPLDSLLGDVFDFLDKIQFRKNEIVAVWGPTFERCLLKILLGLIGTKKMSDSSGAIGIDAIHESWIRVLYGQADLPDNVGLFSAQIAGRKYDAGLKMATLLLNGKIAGLRATVGHLNLHFSMFDKATSFKTDHEGYSQILLHPREFIFQNQNSKLLLFWPDS